MKRIPSQFVQDLKHSLNIVEVAGGYMKLVKKGQNHFARCPFHSEKTPSFSLNEQLQIFHCFGCGKSGDIISLIMELEGMSYVETIHYLAERAGLRIPTLDGVDEREFQDRKFLYTVMEEAVRFYRRHLLSPDGQGARAYLERRRITPETGEKFLLGCAPDSGFQLLNHLRSLGIRDHFIQLAGLAGKSSSTGRLYDQFRNRLIVPITDLHGRVIALGGRILGDGEPKYLNSRETPIYQKGHHLFGLTHSHRDIRTRDTAVLVEGYFDMIVPFQEGFPQMVASLGTSLTPNQIKLLGRFTRNVIICFDPDTAGSAAAYRSVELFLENDFECRVARLPEGHDPDTFALEAGAEAFQSQLDEAVPFLEFVWQRLTAGFKDGLTVKNRVRVMEALFPFILRIPQGPERNNRLEQLARRLSLAPEAVFKQFNQFSRSRRVDQRQVRLNTPGEVLESERLLIRFLFSFPELAPRIISETDVTFDGLASSNILAAMQDMIRTDGQLDLSELEKGLEEKDLVLLHQILSREVTIVSEEEAVNSLRTLKEKSLERELELINNALEEAEASGDMEQCRVLLKRKKKIKEIIQN